MINKNLSPRQQYDVAYAHMRLYGGVIEQDTRLPISDEIEDCASLSYDNRSECFEGWTNALHMKLFRRVAPYRKEWDGIPF